LAAAAAAAAQQMAYECNCNQLMLCCALRRCAVVAAGTEDGYIIIWDVETRGMAKLINGHR
jgi:hypothetical protein